MPYALICAHHEGEIFECCVYDRQLAPVIFEESTMSIAVYQDPCIQMSQFCLVRCRLTHCQGKHESVYQNRNQTSNAQLKYEDNNNLVTTSEDESEYIHQSDLDLMRCHVCGESHLPCKNQQLKSDHCSNWQWHEHDDSVNPSIIHETLYIQLQAFYRTCLQFPANLANCVFQELRHSRVFRKRFMRFVRRNYKFCDMRERPCVCTAVQKICDYTMPLPVLIEVCVIPADIQVCLPWSYRLEGLLKKRSILETMMAGLSTLGGGYSSLGDYFTFHSEQAGKISMTQLRLSMEMGDPIMAAKCRLFYALSMMQRGALRWSKYIIRYEFQLAKSMIVKDTKLISMCHGLWTRLMFAYKNRAKQRRLTQHSGGNVRRDDGTAPIYYLLMENDDARDQGC